jgi:hypothetical protein
MKSKQRLMLADIGETPIQPDEQRPITAGKPHARLEVQQRLAKKCEHYCTRYNAAVDRDGPLIP